MNEFKLKQALGKYVIVEPFDQSTVLKTSETATVFKVFSVGLDSFENKYEFGSLKEEPLPIIKINDLIIVAKASVETTMMGNKEIYYVRDSDVIARIE